MDAAWAVVQVLCVCVCVFGDFQLSGAVEWQALRIGGGWWCWCCVKLYWTYKSGILPVVSLGEPVLALISLCWSSRRPRCLWLLSGCGYTSPYPLQKKKEKKNLCALCDSHPLQGLLVNVKQCEVCYLPEELQRNEQRLCTFVPYVVWE